MLNQTVKEITLAASTGRLRSTKMTLSFGGSEPQPNSHPQSQSVEAMPSVPKTELKSVEQKNKQQKSPQPQSQQAAGRNKGQDKEPARDYRTMRSDVKERILTIMVEALGLDTIEQLPVFFRQERIVPAKLGLFNDLVERFQDKADKKELRRVVRPFFADFAYYRSVLDEKQRFDLDMNPVEGEQGEILELHKQEAQKQIQLKLKNIKERQQKQQRFVKADATSAEQGVRETEVEQGV